MRLYWLNINGNAILKQKETANVGDILYNNENFAKPIFDNGVVVEGATAEELAEIENQKKEKCIIEIHNIYNQMLTSALSRVTGQKGTKEYLENLKNEYDKKYTTSFQILNNITPTYEYIANSINLEKEFEDFEGANLENTLNKYGLISLNNRLKDFCQIIQLKYTYSNEIYNDFIGKIATMRTRLITDIQFSMFEKYEQRKAIVLSITGNDSINDINNKFNQFNAI